MADSAPRPALETGSAADRRQFLKGAGAVLGGSLVAGANAAAGPRPLTDEEKLDRLASNTYPLRTLFKRRGGQGPGTAAGGHDAPDQHGGGEHREPADEDPALLDQAREGQVGLAVREVQRHQVV